LDKDLEGWTPEAGEVDDCGQLIEAREYNVRDFDRTITFDQRTQRVAEYVSLFLHNGDPMRKTIIFCENIDHAERMRSALASLDEQTELWGDRPVKYEVSRAGFEVVRERVSYYNKDGELTTESLKDYTRRTVSEAYQSLDAFLKQWNGVERKEAIAEELRAHGVILEALEELVGKEYDLFDLICHVAFDRPPLTRRERVAQVRKRDVFTQYGDVARSVLAALLDKYADQGVMSIENTQIFQLDPFAQLGTPVELVRSFGGKQQYQAAVRELGRLLYDDRA
jgi:type I site-specific restriction endonuclease